MKIHSIYGPPGCGKTTEMLRRLAEAKARGYATEEIAFLSFTKAGANEALSRLGVTRSDLVCTLHALMYRLMRISSEQVIGWKLLKEFGKKMGLSFSGAAADSSEDLGTGDGYMAVLARARARCRAPMEEYDESDCPGERSGFEAFLRGYSAWRLADGVVDFADMLDMYIKAASAPSHGAKVIFIDEAQDLSQQQWRVVDRLLKEDGVEEVHIAGDDDQAIFEWSGADPHGMRKFEEKYDAQRLILDQSWRVPRSVHALALRVATRIRNRVQKNYLPRDFDGEVSGYSSPHSIDFSESMAESPTLVLCRTGAVKQSMERFMTKARIPYRNDGGKPGLFDNDIANAIRAIQKIQRGEPVSRRDLDPLMLVANSRAKQMIEDRKFEEIALRGWERWLNVPVNLIDFYRDTNLAVEPVVRLSTIHGAKGREANRVVLLTEIPGRVQRGMLEQPDAEARVWYTAVTRTRERLDVIDSGEGYSLPLRTLS